VDRRRFLLTSLAGALATPLGAAAQQDRVYRVGVILQGGPYVDTVNGLRDGLRELGLEEGKQLVLDIRDTKSDLKAVEAAARSLETQKVDVKRRRDLHYSRGEAGHDARPDRLLRGD